MSQNMNRVKAVSSIFVAFTLLAVSIFASFVFFAPDAAAHAHAKNESPRPRIVHMAAQAQSPAGTTMPDSLPNNELCCDTDFPLAAMTDCQAHFHICCSAVFMMKLRGLCQSSALLAAPFIHEQSAYLADLTPPPRG